MTDRKFDCALSVTKKQHHLLASALGSNKPFYEDDVLVQVHHRRHRIPPWYNSSHVEDLVKIVSTKGYLAFQESISKCHIMLPLLDPTRNSGYFRFDKTLRKVSGSLSQTVGYALPVVMHEEMYASYKDVLRGPVTTYNSTLPSFVQALNVMIEYMRQSLPGEIEKACSDPTIVRGKKCLERQRHWSSESSLLPVNIARQQEKNAEL